MQMQYGFLLTVHGALLRRHTCPWASKMPFTYPSTSIFWKFQRITFQKSEKQSSEENIASRFSEKLRRRLTVLEREGAFHPCSFNNAVHRRKTAALTQSLAPELCCWCSRREVHSLVLFRWRKNQLIQIIFKIWQASGGDNENLNLQSLFHRWPRTRHSPRVRAELVPRHRINYKERLDFLH